ncbi:class II aldolase/adducin family protein [bacterium]|nr:class II aldolase/adducin family protein [bacterium]
MNLKKSVYKANLYLKNNNLVYGTQGNVSGIDRKKEIVYIKPSGVPYEELKENMIVGVNMDGKVVEGNLKPSVDTIHHLFLYKNLKDIGGICHTHSKFITVFSILKIPIPVFTTTHADVFGKEIPVSKYVDNTQNNIGKEVLRIYKNTKSNAIILSNHGLFTVGETPEKSVFYALMAEYLAEIYCYSLIVSKILNLKITPLDKKEVEKWYARYHSEKYGQKGGRDGNYKFQ